LFRPFALGDASYARKEQGAGLGLAVAKRIIEQAGGTIGFASNPGEGAQFFFTLPISGTASMVPRGELESRQAAPTNLSVLVYLRVEAVTDAVARMLEPFGNHVIRCASMAEAAEHASREKLDAIIAGASDADMLAASPGVKAPLIAILLRGDRAPAATDLVLRWPVESDQLYHALGEICLEAAPGAEPAVEQLAAIDAETFSTLEKSVGVKTLVEILQCYIVTAEQLTSALAEACAEEKWDDASRLAQDIVGAAGGLGLAAITQAARRFAQAAREGQDRHELRNAAQLIVGEHVRARNALVHLYPDVA
jgi:HPt (histidine-containing phosphotransfer) domain-containing protein